MFVYYPKTDSNYLGKSATVIEMSDIIDIYVYVAPIFNSPYGNPGNFALAPQPVRPLPLHVSLFNATEEAGGPSVAHPDRVLRPRERTIIR